REPLHADDWGEDLFTGDRHGFGDAVEHRRFEERTAAVHALATDGEPSAFGYRFLDEAGRIGHRFVVDERAAVHGGVNARVPNPGAEQLCEFVGDGIVDDESIGCRAGLPMLRNLASIAASTAASRFASSNTTNGALPPSSMDVFNTLTAAFFSSSTPTGVE